MEYVNSGELFTYIQDEHILPEIEAVRIFRQIISAVDYCHRFNLCHRDIKPENILLDHNGNVKLADFGFAALQPRGKMLKTSCGSPHYAAPEITQGLSYDGTLSDIWSCGVVLYVMLCGANPFGTGDDDERLSSVLDNVMQCKITFPSGSVSDEAKHLILRILKKRPADRISIAEMWEHPLLVGYESWAAHPEYRSMWLGGPLPSLTAQDCGERIRSTKYIDREILRNLRILWRYDSEQEVIKELLSDEPNYHKVFYSRLMTFRQEQLEEYEKPAFDNSKSDYHHVSKPLRRSSTHTTMSRKANGRSPSTFTIMDDNVRRGSSHRTASDVETEKTYDPHRPSRRYLAPPQTNYTRVTILNRDMESSRTNHLRAHTQSLRHPALMKLQRDEYGLTPTRRPHASQVSDVQSRRNTAPTWATMSSIASSQRSNASSAKIRVSTHHKRPVSFRHTRKRSASFNIPPSSPPTLRDRYRKGQLASSSFSIPSSPRQTSEPELPRIKSRKPDPNGIKGHSRQGSHIWKEEARQVSNELEQVCDEAFTKRQYDPRLSDSSYHSFAFEQTIKQSPRPQFQKNKLVEEPKPEASRKSVVDSYANRPLPPVPGSKNMDPYIHNELARAKEALLRSAEELGDHSIDNAIAQLDRLLKASSTPNREIEDARVRVSSAPEPRYSQRPHLSPVREESHEFRQRTKTYQPYRPRNSTRVVSEPVEQLYSKVPEQTKIKSTIRLVDLDFDPKPQTLSGRKSGNVCSEENNSLDPATQQDFLRTGNTTRVTSRAHDGESFPADMDRSEARVDKNRHRHSTGDSAKISMPVQENNDHQDSKRANGESKLKTWFKRTQQKDDDGDLTPMLLHRRSFAEADGLSQRSKTSCGGPIEDAKDYSRLKDRFNGPSKFLKLFKRKESANTSRFALSDLVVYANDSTHHADDHSSASSQSTIRRAGKDNVDRNGTNSSGSTFTGARHVPREISAPVAGQNWFLRFWQIRPASRTVVFAIPRQLAIRQVYEVMKGWRQFGLTDLNIDRKAFRLSARVHEHNSTYPLPHILRPVLHHPALLPVSGL